MIRGLAAATAIAFLFCVGTSYAARETPLPPHECSPADRSFIGVAVTNMPAVHAWRDDLVRGGDARMLGVAAREAGALVSRSAPRDRALAGARLLMGAALAEYVRAADGDLRRLPRAQELEATLRGHLVEAAPGLAAVGCDVAPLFGA